MAKTSGPLMSLDASGSFAKTLTYAKWKGRNYVRHLVTPTNPQTTGQQTARAALASGGKINSFIEPASDADVALTAAAPSGQSGASYFSGLCAKAYSQSKTDYENATYSTEKGFFDTEAAAIGMTSFTIPGATPVTVPAGLVLWTAYSVMNLIDNTLAPSLATVATDANVQTFTASLSVA